MYAAVLISDNLHIKLEVHSFTCPKDMIGAQNLIIGCVILMTLL